MDNNQITTTTKKVLNYFSPKTAKPGLREKWVQKHYIPEEDRLADEGPGHTGLMAQSHVNAQRHANPLF